MQKHGLYLLSPDFHQLVRTLGGQYEDTKTRPIYCCIEDARTSGLFYAIPTSDWKHRTPFAKERILRFMAYDDTDLRSAYYELGQTNRPAIFKISQALPITDKYILKPYEHLGLPYIIQDQTLITRIQHKLTLILRYEQRKPNTFEQHISSIRDYLTQELINTSPPNKYHP